MRKINLLLAGHVKMNWDAISAISEVVGVAAVLVTFIYLAVQIKQHTSAVATSTYESVMTGFNDINVLMASDAKLACLSDRGARDLTSLTAVEKLQFNALVRCYANQWWKLLKLRQRGGLPQAEWEIFAREAAQFWAMPGCRAFRSHNALFADLYAEIDKYGDAEISDWNFTKTTEPDQTKADG